MTDRSTPCCNRSMATECRKTRSVARNAGLHFSSSTKRSGCEQRQRACSEDFAGHHGSTPCLALSGKQDRLPCPAVPSTNYATRRPYPCVEGYSAFCVPFPRTIRGRQDRVRRPHSEGQEVPRREALSVP